MEISHQIHIEEVKDEVWNVLSNLENIRHYYVEDKTSEFTTEQESGVGAARVCERLPMGFVEDTITEWNEGEGYTYTTEPYNDEHNALFMKAWPFQNIVSSFEVEASEDGTDVTFTVSWEIGPGVPLTNDIVEKKFTWLSEQLLVGLKEYIETGEKQSEEDKKELLKEFN